MTTGRVDIRGCATDSKTTAPGVRSLSSVPSLFAETHHARGCATDSKRASGVRSTSSVPQPDRHLALTAHAPSWT
jgi:hypothetical protein